jgi:hypothetical protein
MEGPAKPFGFQWMDDLAADRRQIDWLVKDIIECGTHGMLFGDPESGKTLVLFDLLYSVASGQRWRHRRVKQGPVFYLCGEGAGGLGRRAQAWRMHNNAADGERYPFLTSNTPAALLDQASARAVCDGVKAMCDQLGDAPVAIGIDTLARNFGGGDENSAKDIGQFIAHIDEYLIEELGCAVITSHHTGHSTKDRARGSMSLPGALDVFYQVAKDDTGRIEMVCKKSKDFKAAGPFSMKLEVVNLGYDDEDGAPVTGATVTHVKYQAIKKAPELKGWQRDCYNKLVNIYERTVTHLLKDGSTSPVPMIDMVFWQESVVKEKVPVGVGPGDDKWNTAMDQARRAMRILLEKRLVLRRDEPRWVYPAHKE